MTLAPSTLTIHVNAPPSKSSVENLLAEINATYDIFTLTLRQIYDDIVIVDMYDNLTKFKLTTSDELTKHLQSSLHGMIELDWIETQFEKHNPQTVTEALSLTKSVLVEEVFDWIQSEFYTPND